MFSERVILEQVGRCGLHPWSTSSSFPMVLRLVRPADIHLMVHATYVAIGFVLCELACCFIGVARWICTMV